MIIQKTNNSFYELLFVFFFLEVKYMLKYTHKRIKSLYNYIQSGEFLKIAKSKKTSFSRERKLTIKDTVLFSLGRKGKTLKMVVRNYFMERNYDFSVTRQAYIS